MDERNLNEKIARFSYRGKNYEIDLLTDANDDGFKEYDIFHCLGRKSELITHLSTKETKKGRLIELAKDTLSDIV